MNLYDVMLTIPYPHRYRWCTACICGCMGCANKHVINNGFTKRQWEEWVEHHPYSEDDNKKWLSDFIGTKIKNQEIKFNVSDAEIVPTKISSLTDHDLAQTTIREHKPIDPVLLFINSTEFRNVLESNITNGVYEPTVNVSECISNIIAECSALRK